MIDVDAVFWIASCTKLITSIAALQQVEQGKVSLDEDITRLVPEIGTLPIMVEDDSSSKGYMLKGRKNTITLRQLLSHSSGMGYQFMNSLITKWQEMEGPSRDAMARSMLLRYSNPLLFEPGTSWMYGAGVDWAGIVVERLSGLSLGDYFERHIFDPLGIVSTTFHIDRNPKLLMRLMPASRRGDDGRLSSSETNGYPLEMNEHSGGGGLWSSVSDFVKVLADLIAPSPKLLKVETIDGVLAAPQLGDSAVKSLMEMRGGAVASNAAAVGGVPPISYGCGGMICVGDTDILPKGSLTWGGMPNLKWFLHRGLGVAAMYSTQVLPQGDAKNIELSSQFFKEVLRIHKERQGD
jgi:CubicO group peptidase (beta-lactamase class C family)